MRRWAAVAVSLALFAPQSAHASPREECISSSMDGQTLRLKGKLHAARLKLRECSNSACPKLIRHDCVDWLGKLASAMPTIVIGALDGAGKDVADVHVSLDGDALPFPLDGKPIEVDPGSH
ncbi:MAG: hypothetical protein ACREJX_04150, partial [Polyangiaceae bacterium]